MTRLTRKVVASQGRGKQTSLTAEGGRQPNSAPHSVATIKARFHRGPFYRSILSPPDSFVSRKGEIPLMTTTALSPEQLQTELAEQKQINERLQSRFDDEQSLFGHLIRYLLKQDYARGYTLIMSAPHFSAEQRHDMHRYLEEIRDGYA